MTLEPSTQPSMTAEGLLRELSSHAASGVLEISHPAGSTSHVWTREGRIYAMQVPGYRPALGIRLLSGGLISPEQLSTAAAEQRNRFPKSRIGEVLVGMGFVTEDVIDAFVLEQVHDQIADLLDLTVEGAAFHPGRMVRQDVISPTEVEPLLEVARDRRAQRADILAQVGGQHVVPTLGPPGRGSAHTPLGPYDWALLCRVDGRRDVTELARVCGFTLLEAAQVVSDLAATGLVELPRRVEAAGIPLADVVPLHPEVLEEPEPAAWSFAGTDAGEPEPVLGGTPEPDPGVWVEAQDLLAEFSAFVHEDEPISDPGGASAPVAGPMDAEVSPEAFARHGGHPLLVAGGAGREVEGGAPTPAESSSAAVEVPAAEDSAEVPAAEDSAEVPAAEDSAEEVPAAEIPAPDVPAPEVRAAENAAPEVPAAEVPAAELPAAELPAESVPTVPAARVPDGEVQVRSVPEPSLPSAVDPASADSPFNDTSLFMRELSSLSDDPDKQEPIVTRLVVPLTEPKRKRRLWGR